MTPTKGDKDPNMTSDPGWLTKLFEEQRPRLRGVAFRLVGSLSDAEDAVQETWLRLHRTEPKTIDNLAAWLTIVVSRVCLDMLRARQSRREESIETPSGEMQSVVLPGTTAAVNPEDEAVLADSVGVALLVVLDSLSPAERVAFVLHDLFATPFDEIADIMGRSPDAAKQLASRARRRVRGSHSLVEAAVKTRQREVVEAFLSATRTGNLDNLLAVLDPDAVLRMDGATRMAGGAADAANVTREIKGAALWARQMIAMATQIAARSRDAQSVQPALIDGSVGLVLAPRGKLAQVLAFTFSNDGRKITSVEAIKDQARLREFEIAVV
jgi:RNA polymerase sigma factor (sigma-70 family)